MLKSLIETERKNLMAFENKKQEFDKVAKSVKADMSQYPTHSVAEPKKPRGHGSYTLRQDLLDRIQTLADQKQISKSAIVEKALMKELF